MSADFRPSGAFATSAGLLRRRRKERVMKTVLMAGSSLSVLILAVLLFQMLRDGLPAFDPAFFTQSYNPSAFYGGAGSLGILDSILATMTVLAMTMLFAVPIGTAAGIYLHEYAVPGRLTNGIRATVANLAAVPSIVYGLLGLAVFVTLMSLGATNIASALTLAVLILPILIVATEEALKTVPRSVRDASLAVGATKWQTVRSHVLPYALPGILTGQILALSRAAGETAPLIVLGIPVFTPGAGTGPLDQGTPLQVRAFNLASDPNRLGAEMAAGAILVLLLATLLLNLAAIVLRARLSRKIQW